MTATSITEKTAPSREPSKTANKMKRRLKGKQNNTGSEVLVPKSSAEPRRKLWLKVLHSAEDRKIPTRFYVTVLDELSGAYFAFMQCDLSRKHEDDAPFCIDITYANAYPRTIDTASIYFAPAFGFLDCDVRDHFEQVIRQHLWAKFGATFDKRISRKERKEIRDAKLTKQILAAQS